MGVAKLDRSAGEPSSEQKTPARPARALFRVPFRSAMGDEEAGRLRRALDIALHLHPKHPAVAPPVGVAPLSLDSSLYLVRGHGEEEWALEGRTWGDPGPELVRLWLGEATLAARRLDRTVPFPGTGHPDGTG